ncbi:protein SMAX1-LIKE 6 [Prunus yedoensis var. nudiflora]|uniref:Protein SMAX1-LIKE 6 n=1 Tax=Prunus yedoensis var. nudiflora TaxID=2094558 RepID=A0A314UAV5_PRUYE|nr:protein SMAX1-LIKE 6 [Prunus yedoensis var. nudiflora]
MPTPVSAARQCLTEDAARALDDAVAVARRRSHAQTTSLHAVSALLALPSSTIRDACARARSSAYSPRLQFRALELSVGVSLDRLPSSKAQDEPPVSNSLMAAIKRSQANQRRHPESFHLHQIHNQQQTASLLKVELKHFILSILDDPIVSRVFGEAGFRSCDIKLAILHPPVTQSTRFPRTRCPPIFLCNLTDADPARPGFSFPFSGVEDRDENSRRIGDVLVRKSGRNPLLIGVCASEALKSFTEAVQKGKTGLLPAEITSFSVVCIDKEISEFVVDGGSEEKMGFKFKDVGQMAERCSGAGTGIIVNYGDLKALVGEGVVGESVSFVVMQLKSLLEIYSEKLWLIGAAASHEVYKKLLALFSTIEKDWDLHLLPITSSKASMEGIYSKSSLMGSFVPFGGFFPGPSDFKNPLSSTYQSFRRCHQCTEKYEQEVAAILNLGSTISAGDQCSDSLPSWLQIPELDSGKGVDLEKTKDDKTTLNAISALQKKWNDICRQNHHTQPFPKVDCYQTGCQVASAGGSRAVVDGKANSGEDSCLNESRSAIQYGCQPMNMKTSFLLKQNSLMQVVSNAENASPQSELLVKDSKGQRLELGSPCRSPYPTHSVNLPTDRTSSSSVTSVTTDLGLGTLYASTSLGPRSPRLQDHKESLGHLSGSISAEFDALSENTSQQIAQSSSCSGSDVGGQCDPRDIKSLRRVLTEKVGWQDEAICTISQAVSHWRSGGGRNRGSKLRGDIWLTLIGPDRVGKKKIALALAEILFGTRESLISVDLGSQDRGYQSNSIFQCEGSDDYDVKFRGKTVVDYVAGELSRRPHSVFFLENVDKADFLAQSNLLKAITTGKFPDSHGREISINNIIFVTTSAIKKRSNHHYIENEPLKFSEEIILSAKRCQMQIRNLGDVNQSKGMNVRIAPREGTSNPCSVNKRKLIDTNVSIEQSFELQKRSNKALRSFLDLNLPVEETDECIDSEGFDSDSTSENSEAWLEDFLDRVDVKVVLKPFDFDALAEKIVKEISQQFKKIFGSEVQLEIDLVSWCKFLQLGGYQKGRKH